MRKFLCVLLIVAGLSVFADMFVNFDSFLGMGVFQRLTLEGEEKQIDALTSYGVQFSFDYGLHRGLRFGAIVSSQNFSVRFEGESHNFGLFCLGFEGTFAMDFLDIVLQISGEGHWVLASIACQDGKLSQADYTGNLFAGKVLFEKFLSENLSVAVGGGLKYLLAKNTTLAMDLTGIIPYAVLRIGYSF
ncbi:MAG: Uncharacterized protein XD58_1072 [Thermotoga sp. 50_1627]|uniref:hypothetical protein n=1 Tax=Pseudothermotoga sp. TaxID=2033661 RepID=UPI00076D21CA|nr:MAG: Uncharacterized protein XD45_1344 [Thermotoga sp. 50_64]KUK24955.1 MAG: Uncharacterized protein XD58_1072 [Thermotoga sp. 50_1627]MBC7116655.1 hypothetical protein [Pseudothermotoga sp.]MDK2922762.1 hypothetical protein [Pseudothermotoga sp.]HBT39308.1 hypothetical protein [Pseudothermotoga sp.]